MMFWSHLSNIVLLKISVHENQTQVVVETGFSTNSDSSFGNYHNLNEWDV